MGPSGAGPGAIFVRGVDDPRIVINGNSVHSIGTAMALRTLGSFSAAGVCRNFSSTRAPRRAGFGDPTAGRDARPASRRYHAPAAAAKPKRVVSLYNNSA